MSLRNRRNRERRRWLQRLVLAAAKWLVVAAVIVAIGVEAHRTGARLARVESEQLAAALSTTRSQVAALEQDVEQAHRERDRALAAEALLQQRYQSDVPKGPLAAVLDVVRQRIESGVGAERLRDAIRATTPVIRCDGPPISRRFRITAGERPAPDDGTSFLEGLIRVQGAAPEGFDDLARTMLITFSGVGLDAPASHTGLPATQVFHIGNYELIVAVTASPIPAFATAAITGCRIG